MRLTCLQLGLPFWAAFCGVLMFVSPPFPSLTSRPAKMVTKLTLVIHRVLQSATVSLRGRITPSREFEGPEALHHPSLSPGSPGAGSFGLGPRKSMNTSHERDLSLW